MIRIDSLLVRALAEALDDLYRNRAVRALRLDPASRTATFAFHGELLILSLDPTHPAVHRRPGRLDRMDSALPAGLRVQSVRALPDERILEWRFDADDPPPRVMIEWLTNRLNALVIGPDDVIRAILAPREGERRNLTAGALYELPPPTGRRGTAGMLTEEEFIEFLAPIEPAQRSRALLRGMAYVSPLNANAILGPALLDATEATLLPAWTRYRDIVSSGSTGPCTFAGKDGPQPYPVPLPGVECTPAEDLFAAFDRAETEAPPGDPLQPALDRLDRKRDRVQSRLHRLREEAAGAAVKAERLRRDAGLLLSQPHAAPRGTDRTILDDFDGGSVEVELDPALSAAENAEKLFENARKRDRAAARLPQLIAEAEREHNRLESLRAAVEAGDLAPDDVLAPRPARASSPQPRALPYKRYRTSGGLEVRVGRGARTNDDLTFHHARPDDIWMHARDVGGAHVVLRWEHREANPPAADLREAAILAALHSKARTSGVVPVDWTRRKYVRKPRKAPPGRVLVERVKTIFVEPDEKLNEKLRTTDA